MSGVCGEANARWLSGSRHSTATAGYLKMNMGLHVILLMVKCMFAVMMVRYNLIIKLFNLYCQ